MNTLSTSRIVFDLDGVLVDSSACVDRIWHRWVARNGLEKKTDGFDYHGRRTIDAMRLFLDEGAAVREAAVFEADERNDLDGVREIAGAKELVGSLPVGTWAIATSGSRVLAAKRLQKVGLPEPAVFVTAEDVSRGKPDPAVYSTAVQRLDVSPSLAVAVEDAPAGILAAKAAGLVVIGVSTTHPSVDLRAADFVVAGLDKIKVAVNSGRLFISLSD